MRSRPLTGFSPAPTGFLPPWPARGLRIFTPRAWTEAMLQPSRDSSLVSARDPLCPGSRAFFLGRSAATAIIDLGMAASHHGHSHAMPVEAGARPLALALVLIVAFMAGEVVAAIIADSLALLADAAHMLTDAVAIAL